MPKALTCLFLPLLLAGCMESAEPTDSTPYNFRWSEAEDLPPESDRTFAPYEHVGLITPDMAVASIENRYGTDALRSRPVPGPDGDSLPGYVLFLGTADELLIVLGADKQPERVSFTNPRTRWHHEGTNLTIGTELGELREMNGAPFDFTGFGWDSAGTVVDWHGGALEDILVRLTYAPERVAGGGLPDTLLGDRLLYSDSTSVRDLGIRVREISVPLRDSLPE